MFHLNVFFISLFFVDDNYNNIFIITYRIRLLVYFLSLPYPCRTMWLLPKQQKVAYKGNINQSDGFTGVHTFCKKSWYSVLANLKKILDSFRDNDSWIFHTKKKFKPLNVEHYIIEKEKPFNTNCLIKIKLFFLKIL